MNIAVVGLGKLGMPYLACLSSSGFQVIGVDKDTDKLDKLLGGNLSWCHTPLLRETINWDNVTFTEEAWSIRDFGADVIMVIVPTPSGTDGRFSVDNILDVFSDIGDTLPKDHHIILVSTVMPGDITGKIIPHIRKVSGLEHIHLVYAPEFLALGTEIVDIMFPNHVILGADDQADAHWVSVNVYNKICGGAPHPTPMILLTNYVNAEIAKIAINAYMVTKITFINSIASICEAYHGANIDTVSWLMGHDCRINDMYLKGGNRAGGPCFPRDIRALDFLDNKVGSAFDLANAVARNNDWSDTSLSDKILQAFSEFPPGPTYRLGILGLTFKPRTDCMEESTGVYIAKWCQYRFPVTVYDPVMIRPRELIDHGENISYALTVLECIENSDVVVIVNADPEFYNIEHYLAGKTVIDCWRILDISELPDDTTYYAIGVG